MRSEGLEMRTLQAGCARGQAVAEQVHKETKEDLNRDRLWCTALVSLLGEGLTTEHVHLITKRVNEMREGKAPVQTEFENLRLHAVNYLEAVFNDRKQKTLRSSGARMKAEELLKKLLDEIKPKG